MKIQRPSYGARRVQKQHEFYMREDWDPFTHQAPLALGPWLMQTPLPDDLPTALSRLPSSYSGVLKKCHPPEQLFPARSQVSPQSLITASPGFFLASHSVWMGGYDSLPLLQCVLYVYVCECFFSPNSNFKHLQTGDCVHLPL